MSAAREEILRRVRAALADVPADERPTDVPVAREYRRRVDQPLVESFAERVSDYRAEVRRVKGGRVRAAVDAACAERGLRTLAVPAAVPAEWRPSGAQVIEDQGLTAPELDRIDGALTGCAAGIAQTGTLVLDGRGVSGRRLLTLVPDHHICVVRAEQIVGLVPEAIATVRPPTPITLVSGPSASSDIELSRVEGVHGPRNLLVLIVE